MAFRVQDSALATADDPGSGLSVLEQPVRGDRTATRLDLIEHHDNVTAVDARHGPAPERAHEVALD
jgi:hypothetical protein